MAINEPRIMHKHTSTRNESHVQPLNTNFSKQEVDLQKTPLFFPEGFEMIFLGIYFMILPYIAGILFLFFYVADSSPDLFSSIYEDSFFMLTWTIGYEILAALLLLYIVKMSLTFANENRKPKPKVKSFH
jgi:hypothetical protein